MIYPFFQLQFSLSLFIQKHFLLPLTFLQIDKEENQTVTDDCQGGQKIKWKRGVVREYCVNDGAADDRADKKKNFADDVEKGEK